MVAVYFLVFSFYHFMHIVIQLINEKIFNRIFYCLLLIFVLIGLIFVRVRQQLLQFVAVKTVKLLLLHNSEKF